MLRLMLKAQKGLPLVKALIRNKAFHTGALLCSVQKSTEIYQGYDPNRTLDDVDIYAATSQKIPEPPTENELYGHREYSFKKFFMSGASSVHEVKEGGYVAISDEDMQRYLPDAVMGEVTPEFELSEEKAWMMRDSSKLLFRIIEEYEKNKNVIVPKPAEDEETPGTKQAVSLRVHLSGLTDRPERDDAVMKTFVYGRQIGDTKRPSVGNFDIVCGPGSLVENCIDAIKSGVSKREGFLPTQILVTGVRGTGKSFTLNQTVLYARQRGWLVMVVDGWRQAQYGWFIEPFMFKKEVPGTEELFDNAFMSAEVLRSFYRAHKDTLTTIPIENRDQVLSKYQPILEKFKEEWSRATLITPAKASFIEVRRIIEGEENFEEEDERDKDILGDFKFSSFEAKSLADLIMLGLFIRDFAGSVVIDLVSQLKELESHRVLFVVDGYNSWEVPSVYQFEMKPVMPKQLCVPYALNFLSRHKKEQANWKLKNGLAIGFDSFKHPQQKDVYHDSMHSIQLVLQMPVYSSTEYLAAMRLYLEHSGVFESDIRTQDILGFRVFCQSNPRLVREECFGYFLPISSQRYADVEDPYDDSILKGYEDEDDLRPTGSRKGDRDASDDDFDDADGLSDTASDDGTPEDIDEDD